MAGRGIPFDGLTEEWRIVGEMDIDGRLSDALNKRDAITISKVRWAPIDGSESMAEAPGLKTVDPYDLIIVLAGEATLPPLVRRGARRAQGPQDLLRRGAGGAALPGRRDGLPLPGLGAGAADGPRDRDVRAGRGRGRGPDLAEPLADELDAILVNRFYLRGVEQIDKRTGERHPRMPGHHLRRRPLIGRSSGADDGLLAATA